MVTGNKTGQVKMEGFKGMRYAPMELHFILFYNAASFILVLGNCDEHGALESLAGLASADTASQFSAIASAMRCHSCSRSN